MSESHETGKLREELETRQAVLFARIAEKHWAISRIQVEKAALEEELRKVQFGLQLLPREGQDE